MHRPRAGSRFGHGSPCRWLGARRDLVVRPRVRRMRRQRRRPSPGRDRHRQQHDDPRSRGTQRALRRRRPCRWTRASSRAAAPWARPTASPPRTSMPSIESQLAMCSGGYCEPDPIIQNPTLVPPSCTAFNSTPGACISVCVPEVQQYLSILTQGSCASDERCAPCVNPLNNTNSGACDVGKTGQCGASDSGSGNAGDAGAVCPYTGPPKVDPTTFPACSPACGGAHCVPASLVPAAQQSELLKCPSAGADAGGDGGTGRLLRAGSLHRVPGREPPSHVHVGGRSRGTMPVDLHSHGGEPTPGAAAVDLRVRRTMRPLLQPHGE